MNPIDNAIVLEEAKRYTNSQRLAYTEWTEGSITWDGDTTDKVVLSGIDLGVTDDDKYTYVRISENGAYNPLNLKKIAQHRSDGALIEVFIDLNVVYMEDGGSCFVYAKGISVPVLLVIFDDEEMSGTYGLLVTGTTGEYSYVSSITGNIVETIHPIDQKFLPGVTLNLCDYGINAYDLIQKGTSGYFTIDASLSKELHAKIPTDGTRVVLMTNDGNNPVLYDQSATIVVNPSGKAGAISSFVAMPYTTLNVILYVDVHIVFHFNTEDDHISHAVVYYNYTTNPLPATEVS